MSDPITVLLGAAAVTVVITIIAIAHSLKQPRPKPQFKSRRDEVGLLGLAADQLFGKPKPKSQKQTIREIRGRQVDTTTGEIISSPTIGEVNQSINRMAQRSKKRRPKPRRAIIGWIDLQTGEITPNPKASKIAKEKGVM